MLSYIFKPLDEKYPRELTPSGARVDAKFKVTWSGVQDILERELRMLGYREGSVVLQTAHNKYDVRKDGQLRGDVRAPSHPGVIVSFDVMDDTGSRWIQMAFESDRFTQWKDNVRAIADAMEALRKIDRYGVSGVGKSGAQYEGYKRLESAEGKIGDYDMAIAFLSEHSGIEAPELQASSIAREKAFRKAARKFHPDSATGDLNEFQKLNDVRMFLEQQGVARG